MNINRRKTFVLLVGTTALALVRSMSLAFPAPVNEKFMSLSSLLTGHADLDASIGETLQAALQKVQMDFQARLIALETALAKANIADFAKLDALSTLSSTERGTAIEIVSAWYFGRVGNNSSTGGVAAYEKALMFSPTEGLISIPGFPVGGPDYWTETPKTSGGE